MCPQAINVPPSDKRAPKESNRPGANGVRSEPVPLQNTVGAPPPSVTKSRSRTKNTGERQGEGSLRFGAEDLFLVFGLHP